MNKVSVIWLLFAFIAISSCQNPASKSPDKPVIFTIGKEPVYVDEFKYVYEKHNSSSDDFYSHESVHEYLDLYTNFRLKIKEAENLKMDTSKAFIEELSGHRKSLAKPYLTEKKVTEELVQQAYERLKEEVRASHILVLVKPEAEPKDTLTAYKKMETLRKRIAEGEDFGEMAKRYSEDRSAEVSKGDLGYFSSFSMVYPFEDMAYKTEVGQVSPIFRTQFGYHILKVTDKRPSKGKYKVAHIMIRASQGMDKPDSLNAKNKIDKIYSKLKAGEDWGELCRQFSEDGNSKSRDGELQLLDVNSRIVNEFKDAAFALVDVGDYSEPVQTPYGWHIIKLLEKQPLESFEEMEQGLRVRIERDSRSEMGQKVLLKRLRKENKLVEHEGALNLAVSKADSSVINGNFSIPPKDKDFSQSLISIMDETYSIADFYKYMNTQKKTRKVSPEFYVKLSYSDYVDDMLLDYENRHLEEKYYDFKMLYKEYRDGILMFNLMDQKVWSKSTRDTTGLQNYFEKNRNKYEWEQRVDAVIYDCENKLIAEKVKTELPYGKYPVTTPNSATFYYDYRASGLSEVDSDKLLRLTKRLRNEDHLYVRLTATTSKKEAAGSNKNIVTDRLEKVKSYLVESGVPEDQILTINAAYRYDREKGDKIKRSLKVEFLSSKDNALENYINSISPLGLKIQRGKFEKGDIPALDKVEWEPGEYTFVFDDRTYFIKINEVLEPRPKELNEVRGEVISDYQEYLENEWLHTLRQKYPIEYNEGEIKKLIRE